MWAFVRKCTNLGWGRVQDAAEEAMEEAATPAEEDIQAAVAATRKAEVIIRMEATADKAPAMRTDTRLPQTTSPSSTACSTKSNPKFLSMPRASTPSDFLKAASWPCE